MVIVDDSKEIISVIEDLLSPAKQFEVVGRCATEQEATEWVHSAEAPWDVAVIDLVLREGSGFNLLRRFREVHPKGRIVVLSDYATLNIKLRCVELGADSVFTKGEFKAFVDYVLALRPNESLSLRRS